jgi:hypothetical protein
LVLGLWPRWWSRIMGTRLIKKLESAITLLEQSDLGSASSAQALRAGAIIGERVSGNLTADISSIGMGAAGRVSGPRYEGLAQDLMSLKIPEASAKRVEALLEQSPAVSNPGRVEGR